MKLDLGCGLNKREGFIGVDKVKLPGVDVVHDFEKTPLPFNTNSVDFVYSHHVLEHVRNLVPLMEELYRICKPGALIEIFVPYYKEEGAFADPTHVRFFTLHSFDYFDDTKELGKEYYFYSTAKFRVRKAEIIRGILLPFHTYGLHFILKVDK